MAAYIGNKRFQLTTALNGLGGPAKWGEITGQISAQADLQQEFQEVSALIMTEGIQQLNGIVKNGKMTVYQGNVEKGQFSANQSSDLSIFLDPPSTGGGGDDIYCKQGSTSDDQPGWNFMSITNGQTYIDYSQINSITDNSSKPSKIVGYFEITEADGQDYEIVVGTTGYDYRNNVSFVWKGNARSNGNIKVPFIIVYNPIYYRNYIQVNGGWSTIYMYITAIYNGGQMKGSFQ